MALLDTVGGMVLGTLMDGAGEVAGMGIRYLCRRLTKKDAEAPDKARWEQLGQVLGAVQQELRQIHREQQQQQHPAEEKPRPLAQQPAMELSPPQSRLHELEEELRRLEEKSLSLTPELKRRLSERLSATPDAPLTQLCLLAPRIPAGLLLAYLGLLAEENRLRQQFAAGAVGLEAKPSESVASEPEGTLAGPHRLQALCRGNDSTRRQGRITLLPVIVGGLLVFCLLALGLWLASVPDLFSVLLGRYLFVPR